MTKEVDQVVGGAVQQQAKSIGQEAVTAQAVGAETVLELLDAVLTLAAVVVESEDLGGTSGAVGNHEAQVGSGGRVLGLVADAALTRPTTGAMAEAGKTALRHLGAAIAAFQPFLPRFRTTLKDAVGGNAESILDLEELAELVQQGQSKTGVARRGRRPAVAAPGAAAWARCGHDWKRFPDAAAPPAGIRCDARRST